MSSMWLEQYAINKCYCICLLASFVFDPKSVCETFYSLTNTKTAQELSESRYTFSKPRGLEPTKSKSVHYWTDFHTRLGTHSKARYIGLGSQEQL